MRRLQFPPRQTVRTVQTHVLLLNRVPNSSVEKAQEDVQGADKSAGDGGRIAGFAQGDALPEPVHTGERRWRRTHKCCIRFLENRILNFNMSRFLWNLRFFK